MGEIVGSVAPATARTLIRAVRSTWEEWSGVKRAFQSERPEMQAAFKDALTQKLPDGWSVSREARLHAERRFSAWSLYDIGVLQGSELVGLIELSLGDTNVAHALHNGELKLLGRCDGAGVSSGKAYRVERDLAEADVLSIKEQLTRVPVRGLFFVNPGPQQVLDKTGHAIWWETKGSGFTGETRFRSALMPSESEVTLRQVLERLARDGLCCWFYSLCGEESLEYLTTESHVGG